MGSYGPQERWERCHGSPTRWESGVQRLPISLDDELVDIVQVSIIVALGAYWKWATRHHGRVEFVYLRHARALQWSYPPWPK